MKRRYIVRIQVIVLALLTALVLARAFGGDGRPDGVVVLTRIDAHDLEQAAFRVLEPAQIQIEATGSVESRSDTALAAYAWILDHATREPVWVMSRAHSVRGSGMLVHADTVLSLHPGTYEAYFASGGNDISASGSRSFFSRIFDESQHWINDAGDWSFVIRVEPESTDSVEEVSMEEIRDAVPEALWWSGPVTNRSTTEELIEVREPIEVQVYSIGELTDEVFDYGWIRSAPQGDAIWELRPDNSVYAGGARVNRLFRGTVTLQQGIHAIGFTSDPGHAYGAWRANPPYDPHGWGMRVDLINPADTALVARFDPWEVRRPAVSLAPVGNDEHRTARIRIDEPAPVVLYAMGEIGRAKFDYGTLRYEDVDSTVWEMSAERSTPAGGHRNNRREIAFLTLQPGEYQLEYRTDGSHAFGDWRNGEPENPERWGVTLFTLDGRALGHIELADTDTTDSALVAEAPPPPPPPPSGPELVSMTRIGNDQQRSSSFSVEQTADVHIHAVGEITLSNRYDFGWIEDATTGQSVWEMTYANTRPAGGDSRNRAFQGVIKLPPGRYTAHFQTDFSHSYGDFRSEAETPANPEAWGITIRRLP